jgi:TonB family protein
MRWNRPTLRVLCVLAVVGLVPLWLHADSGFDQHLRDQFQDRTLVIRGFYSGDSLRYDAAGQLLKKATPGDWTVDGIVHITSLSLSGQHLTIQADRLALGNSGHAFGLWQGKNKEDKAKRLSRLHIEVDLEQSGITADAVDAVLSKMFLTPQDRLADLVPDYWKPCVQVASTGKGSGKYAACTFPPEFASIPGVVSNAAETPESGTPGSEPADRPVARMGKGVTPPKIFFSPPPHFSDQASREKYQGVVLLSLVVDKTGHPGTIRIVRPLGLGLDQKAVEAVSTWRFDPSSKDGALIDAEIAIEVDFHLY